MSNLSLNVQQLQDLLYYGSKLRECAAAFDKPHYSCGCDGAYDDGCPQCSARHFVEKYDIAANPIVQAIKKAKKQKARNFKE